MRTKNATAVLFDENLESRGRLSDATRRKPGRRWFVVRCETEAALPGRALVYADRGEWRNREHHARHEAVIVDGMSSLQHICRDDSSVVSRHLGQSRAAVRRGIARGIH